MKTFFITDIDGTLTDTRHRQHLIQNPAKGNCPECRGTECSTCPTCISNGWDKFKKNFKEFSKLYVKDGPIKPTIDLVNMMAAVHTNVLITGREEKYRAGTVKQLHSFGVRYDVLLMRPDGSNSADTEVKPRLLRAYYLENFEFPVTWEKFLSSCVCVFDDRQRVVDMWRQKFGFQVYQVAKGDY